MATLELHLLSVSVLHRIPLKGNGQEEGNEGKREEASTRQLSFEDTPTSTNYVRGEEWEQREVIEVAIQVLPMFSKTLLPLDGRYTTFRERDRVPAISRAASMRRNSIRPGPAFMASEICSKQGKGVGKVTSDLHYFSNTTQHMAQNMAQQNKTTTKNNTQNTLPWNKN